MRYDSDNVWLPESYCPKPRKPRAHARVWILRKEGLSTGLSSCSLQQWRSDLVGRVSTGLSVSLSLSPASTQNLPNGYAHHLDHVPSALPTTLVFIIRVTKGSSHSTQDDLSKRRPPEHHGLLVIKRPCAG